MTEHVDLTDPELHEPKGVATAAVDNIYLADGVGSGSWVKHKAHIGGYVVFDDVTPAYSVTTGGTSDVVINPTFIGTHAEDFTALITPNARIRYDGLTDLPAFVHFNGSIKQASGGTIDMQFVLYKNGVAQEGSRVVRSATSGAWGSVAMGFDTLLSTNDYLEFFLKTPAGTATALFAQMYMNVQGTPGV
ncbi:MAG: hypothetical protein GQ574_14625 [Crocinitomix sp.]|nr:hypothetical protein [Crocinitomix sp.]